MEMVICIKQYYFYSEFVNHIFQGATFILSCQNCICNCVTIPATVPDNSVHHLYADPTPLSDVALFYVFLNHPPHYQCVLSVTCPWWIPLLDCIHTQCYGHIVPYLLLLHMHTTNVPLIRNVSRPLWNVCTEDNSGWLDEKNIFLK